MAIIGIMMMVGAFLIGVMIATARPSYNAPKGTHKPTKTSWSVVWEGFFWLFMGCLCIMLIMWLQAIGG